MALKRKTTKTPSAKVVKPKLMTKAGSRTGGRATGKTAAKTTKKSAAKTPASAKSTSNRKPNKLLDKDIREPLFIFLECEYGRMRIFEEKTIGKSRADVVMVLDDLLCGIEIKSDADSYARLAKQVRDYDKYYDINYAAVGASHGLHVEEHIPPYWGIIVFDLEDGEPDFYIQRRPQMNPKCKPLKKLEILWASELSHISVLNGMPKYTSKNKAFIREKLVEKVDPELLRRQVSEELFNRDYTLFNS